MSTNGINPCDDAEMTDCDGDKVVTMMDVLKEQEDFEEDANAVLGASDDKNCTYSKGYVKRQAIYACMTCTDAKNDPTKRAGVCLACSLTCHENHELIELYTKRHFRCDCGNPKFNSHPCQFMPDKSDLNIENTYNQNFSGVYCTCHRPYPDPESSTDGDMIQCIVCEDWLHCNHLNALVPPNDQYSEMICKACMEKNQFLHDYSDLTVNKDQDVDVLNSELVSEVTTNFNENSTIDITDDKEKVNSNTDNILITQTENADNVEETKDVSDINKEGQNITKADPAEEKEEKEELAESVQKDLNADLNACKKTVNISELENDEKTEAELKSDNQEEDLKSVANTSNDKQTSMIEEKSTPLNDTEMSDNRSQEQVEEDMLLADLMDTDLDQNKDALDNVPSNLIESTTNNLIDENKSETDTMEVSAEDSKAANAGESENIITSEQSENDTSEEHAVTAPDADLIEDETTTKQTESEQSENTANNDSEDVLTTDQTKISPTSEDLESIPNNKEPENETDRLENVSIKEQLHQNEPGNDVSVNEKEVTNEETNHFEKESSTIIPMDENNTDEELRNTIQKDPAENNSNCDSKEPDRIVESDILKRKLSSDENIENVEVKKPKIEGSMCVRPKGVKKVHNGATFWPSNFRTKLCTCNECLSMYKDLSVLFLIDPDDTVTAYEQLGKEKTDGKPASQYEKGMAALSSLGRVQQINALTEYAKLRDKLLDFLKTFKDKKVIVKEEDIKAFFAGMKPVREPDGVYFCR